MQLTRQPGLVVLEHSARPLLVVRCAQVLLVITLVFAAALGRYYSSGAAALGVVVLCPTRREKVLAIENLGLQIERRGVLRYFTYSQLFIPAHRILDIVINEVFVTFEVVHVLEAIVKDADRLTLVFENRLTLAELETAWRALQGSMGAPAPASARAL